MGAKNIEPTVNDEDQQPIMIAEKLRALQAYGHRRSVEVGMMGADAAAATARILKSKSE